MHQVIWIQVHIHHLSKDIFVFWKVCNSSNDKLLVVETHSQSLLLQSFNSCGKIKTFSFLEGRLNFHHCFIQKAHLVDWRELIISWTSIIINFQGIKHTQTFLFYNLSLRPVQSNVCVQTFNNYHRTCISCNVNVHSDGCQWFLINLGLNDHGAFSWCWHHALINVHKTLQGLDEVTRWSFPSDCDTSKINDFGQEFRRKRAINIHMFFTANHTAQNLWK